MIDVVIYGPPVGASRPRVVAGGRRTYMPDGHVRWEEQARQVLAAAWSGPPLDEPVAVAIVVYHHRPARLSRRRDPRHEIPAIRKPDLDNAAKLVLDAAVKAGVLRDDTRVVELSASRWYVAIDDAGAPLTPERVCVRVSPLTLPTVPPF